MKAERTRHVSASKAPNRREPIHTVAAGASVRLCGHWISLTLVPLRPSTLPIAVPSFVWSGTSLGAGARARSVPAGAPSQQVGRFERRAVTEPPQAEWRQVEPGFPARHQPGHDLADNRG